MNYVPFLKSALWFLPVFLAVCAALPFMIFVKKTKFTFAPPAIFLLGVLVFSFFKMDFFQEVAFYCLWTYAGLFYGRLKNALQKNPAVFLIPSAISATALLFVHLAGISLDMQSHKFPPDFVFLSFSVGAFSLVFCATHFTSRFFEKHNAPKILVRFFSIYSLRSMTIFLYQTFAFIPLRFAVEHFDFPAAIYLLAFPLCALLGKVFFVFEKLPDWKKKNHLP